MFDDFTPQTADALTGIAIEAGKIPTPPSPESLTYLLMGREHNGMEELRALLRQAIL